MYRAEPSEEIVALHIGSFLWLKLVIWPLLLQLAFGLFAFLRRWPTANQHLAASVTGILIYAAFLLCVRIGFVIKLGVIVE